MNVSDAATPGVSPDYLAQLNAEFLASDQNRLAQNACSKQDFLELALNKPLVERMDHVYSVRVAEGKPVTNQKQSGRCWIFALLNCMRVPLMKDLNIEELELSQNFLFFYDKLERTFYALQCYLKCARAGEPVDGRLVQHLLTSPVEDGGQWDMLVNLVEKYGVLPKSCWTETFSCEASRRMCQLLSTMIRGFARDIYAAVAREESDAQVHELMASQMKAVHKVLAICLGQPPTSFQWAYYSKPGAKDADKTADKTPAAPPTAHKELAVRLPAMTPVQFYQQVVKPHMDVSAHVCLVHDPRHPTGKLYTVNMLNNMSGARRVLYLNQPVAVLKAATAAMLADGRPVWFGCDVGKRHNAKAAMSDPALYDLALLFGVNGDGNLDKEARLRFGDSLMTHAMVITGVDVTAETASGYAKWRVENSWGDTYGEKGYQAMSDAWFDEFVFEVAVHRRYLAADVLAVLDQEPQVLPAWDPMGALA